MNTTKKDPHSLGTCQVCQQNKVLSQLLPARMVRGGVLDLISKEHPDWKNDGYICYTCLNQYRTAYVQQLMEKDLGELDELEQEVVKSLQDNALLSENLNEEYEKTLTFGDRIADKVAAFGGSWKFIIWFFVFFAVWILTNTVLVFLRPLDPYPFIFLNLLLSLLAAIQAPIILMSQNRQEDRDRIRAENDYQVNLKSEMEVRIISEKLDQLLHQEMRRFMEIQQIQMEMLNEMHSKLS
ncbi:MAG TPA: DUF1003 domain-containing protein [Thiobacillus sp.]|jgi:uncharacterized membrane protein|nr:DUF1003 domain-containing protein [Thiobacillus sp.]